jgi:hypothetical protein
MVDEKCLVNNRIMDHLFIIAMFEDPTPNQQPMMCRYEHELQVQVFLCQSIFNNHQYNMPCKLKLIGQSKR